METYRVIEYENCSYVVQRKFYFVKMVGIVRSYTKWITVTKRDNKVRLIHKIIPSLFKFKSNIDAINWIDNKK